MADGAPLAIAGLWKGWAEPDGSQSFSFTMLTVNADNHPLAFTSQAQRSDQLLSCPPPHMQTGYRVGRLMRPDRLWVSTLPSRCMPKRIRCRHENAHLNGMTSRGR